MEYYFEKKNEKNCKNSQKPRFLSVFSTGLHVEVAIRDHYNVDIRANGDIGQTELDALTDMALIRVLNNWSGNAAMRPNAQSSNESIFTGLMEAFLLGVRETVEIIMAYAGKF